MVGCKKKSDTDCGDTYESDIGTLQRPTFKACSGKANETNYGQGEGNDF